jgi:hypothetical protein
MAELQHHGIKGQRWGIRRYQNKDGSLTPEGKKRANRGLEDAHKLAESHARTEDFTRRLRKGWDGKSQILVSTETKQAYKRQVDDFIRTNEVMKEKYSDVMTNIITENGKSYVYTLLTDKVTGNGYESKIELLEQ